jgi:hypothetical protein
LSARAILTAPAATAALRLDARRKLLPLAFFCVVSGIEMREAAILAEERTLFPCFNFATHENGRRELRVWRGAVESWTPDGPSVPKPDLETVVALVLPMLGINSPGRATVAGADFARRCCLSRVFINVLIGAGHLAVVGKRSLNATPRLSYASLKTFLLSRAL